jgi:hypothetical protein
MTLVFEQAFFFYLTTTRISDKLKVNLEGNPWNPKAFLWELKRCGRESH